MINGKLFLNFPGPLKKLIELDPEMFLNNTSLVWTHNNPDVILNKMFSSITHSFYLVRDGREVVNSIINYTTSPIVLRTNPQYKIKESSGIYNDEKLFSSYVEGWAKHIAGYMSTRNKYCLIRAEDMRLDIRSTAEHVCQYLDIDIDLTDINKISYSSLKSKSPNHLINATSDWHMNFTKRHVDIFKDIAGAELISMEYEMNNEW